MVSARPLESEFEVHEQVDGFAPYPSLPQTILEQLKGLYQKSHTVITPDRIPPTVGMNSECARLCGWMRV